MKRLNIAYFGSPDFSARFLEKLLTDASMNRYIEVKLVVTQPDQKVGRRQILTPTPVKEVAKKYKIPVHEYKFEARNPKSETNSNVLNFKNSNLNIVSNLDIRISDLALVYAFGAIIPKKLLDLPKYGFWCIHPSLLPKYRGTSPMATTLINGDKITGLTIIKMDEKIDHGPIIAQEKYEILPTDKRTDLEIKLTDLAFEMFKKTINVIASGAKQSQKEIASSSSTPRDDILALTPQKHELASYTKKLKKDDGFIPFNLLVPRSSKNEVGKIENSPKKLFNLFRGLYPWPGLWTVLPNGKRLKITNLTMKQSNNLTIESVQLEGKKEVDFETFKKAYKPDCL